VTQFEWSSQNHAVPGCNHINMSGHTKCRSLAQRPEPLVSAWLVGASPLVQIYQSLSMAEGEASCAAEWATFVQQNISNPVVANVTAGNDCLQLPTLLYGLRELRLIHATTADRDCLSVT
jgi:hypothetical protein